MTFHGTQNSPVHTRMGLIRRILISFSLAAAAWLLLACILAWQLYINDSDSEVQRSFLYYLRLPALRFLCYAILTPPMFYIVRRFLVTADTLLPRILTYLTSFPLFVLSYSTLRWSLLPPYYMAEQRWGERNFAGLVAIALGSFADQVAVYFLIVAAAHAYEYFRRSQRQELEKSELQEALAASELQMLKMQLHPHFLFNTLHGISTLVDSDVHAAKAMIVKLSSLLRAAVKHGSADLVTLRDELEFAAAYLDLEKMRLGPRLRFRIAVGEHTSFLFVPQLILQPLIENAIVHGIACCREGGWLEIGSRKSGRWLELYVQNSVRGHSDPGTGLGLANTKARLEHLYGGEGSLQFSVRGDSAEAVVRIPAFLSSFAPRREPLALSDLPAGGP
jgi:two-component system, LytTR family, sensor kinase